MFKVTVTAKVSNRGSLSRVFDFDHEPQAEELAKLRRDAKKEYEQVYGQAHHVAVDISVRRDKSEGAT